MSKTPWGPVGYAVMKRTYARYLDSEHPEKGTEEWSDVIARVVRACSTQLKCGFTEAEEAELCEMMTELRGVPAGRFLWQLGTGTVDRFGLTSLQNCALVVIRDPIFDYAWMFDLLMLGVGVGFNIEQRYIKDIPVIHYAKIEFNEQADADFIVPDSREGWVQGLKKMLKSHFVPDADLRRPRNITISTINVRRKGLPIKTFGGTASGPETYTNGLTEINRLLNQHAGKKPSSVLLHDIADLIGEVVVSGNVRRSALLALGTSDDIDYLHAKRWDEGNYPHYRSNSNNSVNVRRVEALPPDFWEGYQGNGECYGMVNIDLAQQIGRVGDKVVYEDLNVAGVNPCVAENTKVRTSEGVFSVNELVHRPCNLIIHGDSIFVPEGFTVTGRKHVRTLKLQNGYHLTATDNHKVMTTVGLVEMGELTVDNWVQCENGLISKVVSLSGLSAEPQLVYDCTVSHDDHLYIGNGIVISNCGEQTLEPYETCCLAEIFLPNCKTREQLWSTTRLLYRICKHSLRLPCNWEVTREVVHRNMRMGISTTGYLQATEEQRAWLPSIYEDLRRYDAEYSQQHGFPISKKLTTTKPGGTTSLLAGVTAGCHPATFPYYLKRMRVSSSHPLVEEARKRGYHVELLEYETEDGQIRYKSDTSIVDFPVTHGEDTLCADNMTAIEQMDVVRRLQREWCDNSVSCTVMFRPEELDDIQDYLRKHWRTEMKSISFMLHYGHGFRQAPMTPISKEEYERRVALITDPLVDGSLVSREEKEDELEEECIGGACPRR